MLTTMTCGLFGGLAFASAFVGVVVIWGFFIPRLLVTLNSILLQFIETTQTR